MLNFEFTRQCAGDLGIIALDGKTDPVVAMVFFKAAGGYPVFDVFAGGEPTMCKDLPEALNLMMQIAVCHVAR